MQSQLPVAPAKRSPLERALGMFTKVQPGEAPTALLLTLNVFILLTAYYLIKPVREGLILELRSGAEYKSYASGAIALLLVLLVPAYAEYSARVPRNRLVVSVTLLFASNLGLFYLGSLVEGVRHHLGLVFYLWVGVFNMMLVAQFWAFANDIYTEEQGKRLFPLIGIGASVGAALGSKVAELLVVPLGRYQLLLVSGALLSVCALLFHAIHRRETKTHAPVDKHAVSRAPHTSKTNTTPHGAFGLVRTHRYLRLLALFSVVFTLVSSNGEYLLGKLFKLAAEQAVDAKNVAPDQMGAYISALYASFFFYVNIGGILLQTLVVSRLVKYAGLRVAFLVLPMIALAGGLAFLVLPVLGVLRVSKIAENATDYSVNNTVRNMLWLPTTSEMKYRAKQAVDAFFVRIGDVLSALSVALLAGILGLDVRAFAATNVILVAAWLVIARAILKENATLHAQNASTVD